ncbi:hypothetical protein LCGC14_3134330, partial [marine sediment metagenome]
MKTYIGLDAGSVSIKLAVIDENENLVDSVYLRNSGLIETVKNGLKTISNGYNVNGVGATGSGRNFVKMLIGSDLTKTEVLAHTIAALHYYPDLRTLIDIGGEDSKLMIIRDGILEDFVLNNSCSAGTGSSLEAIATRMGIPGSDVGIGIADGTAPAERLDVAGNVQISNYITFDTKAVPGDPGAEEGRLYLKETGGSDNDLAAKVQV